MLSTDGAKSGFDIVGPSAVAVIIAVVFIVSNQHATGATGPFDSVQSAPKEIAKGMFVGAVTSVIIFTHIPRECARRWIDADGGVVKCDNGLVANISNREVAFANRARRVAGDGCGGGVDGNKQNGVCVIDIDG